MNGPHPWKRQMRHQQVGFWLEFTGEETKRQEFNSVNDDNGGRL